MKPERGLARRDDEPVEKIEDAMERLERLACEPRLKREGALERAP